MSVLDKMTIIDDFLTINDDVRTRFVAGAQRFSGQVSFYINGLQVVAGTKRRVIEKRFISKGYARF